MNEKYKSSYSSRIDAMLFPGSNQPVRISDAKSGIIRRLIDIHPTGSSSAPSITRRS
jgi:phage/plasmid-associated DNA primase